jgi:hypothetical protein
LSSAGSCRADEHHLLASETFAPRGVARDGMEPYADIGAYSWLSQIRHVDVGPESRVVREIPAVVIGILVDDHMVRIPQPAVHEWVIVRRHAEVETIEPEAFARTTSQAEDVTRPKAASEASALPRMIQVVMRIQTAGIVADPSAVIILASFCRKTDENGTMPTTRSVRPRPLYRSEAERRRDSGPSGSRDKS